VRRQVKGERWQQAYGHDGKDRERRPGRTRGGTGQEHRGEGQHDECPHHQPHQVGLVARPSRSGNCGGLRRSQTGCDHRQSIRARCVSDREHEPAGGGRPGRDAGESAVDGRARDGGDEHHERDRGPHRTVRGECGDGCAGGEQHGCGDEWPPRDRGRLALASPRGRRVRFAAEGRPARQHHEHVAVMDALRTKGSPRFERAARRRRDVVPGGREREQVRRRRVRRRGDVEAAGRPAKRQAQHGWRGCLAHLTSRDRDRVADRHDAARGRQRAATGLPACGQLPAHVGVAPVVHRSAAGWESAHQIVGLAT
jgi:hypothetical protein